MSSIAKASKIAVMVPVSETATCAAPQTIHPYVFRGTSSTDVEGLAKAILMARRKDVKTVDG